MDNKYRHLRTCPVCEQTFDGVRRVCDPCRYREGKGLPVLVRDLRAVALAGHMGQIRTEMAAIRRAGLDPALATYDELRAIGI